jgi:hypothetical protein
VRAQERARELRNDRRSLDQAETHLGRWRLSSPWQNAGELSSVEDKERKRVGLSPFPGKRVRGCTSVWMSVKVRAKGCAVHTDVKTATEALTAARHGARTRRHRALNKGWRVGCARGGVGSNTCKRLLLNLARRPASDSAMARRRHGKALSDDRDLGSKARRHRG